MGGGGGGLNGRNTLSYLLTFCLSFFKHFLFCQLFFLNLFFNPLM